jgi:hypothetical protein
LFQKHPFETLKEKEGKKKENTNSLLFNKKSAELARQDNALSIP